MIRHIAAAAAVALAVATPATASTTITFTGGSSATDGPDGNIRTGYGSGGIQVQAAAFSYDGSTLEQAWLGAYSSGLGVTNNGEGNGTTNNNHTIDNSGQKDFVLLIFNQAVNIQSAVLTPFSLGSGPTDNDAWISYANFALPFTTPGTQVPLNSALWAALNGVDYTVNGNTSSPYSVNFNSSGFYGNVWLIGAANPNPDSYADGFKLSSIKVNAAVPEPATWAMMLLGFGAIGLSVRARRRSGIAVLAA